MGNKSSGFQTHTYPSGDKYEGWFKNGKREGRGIYISNDGHRYEGDFHDDMRHGKGILTFAKSTATQPAENREVFGSQWAGSYSGQWQRNQKHGFGVFLYPNNDKYDGEWFRDRKQGFGVYTYANGDRYEGEWLNGMMHGSGTWFTHEKNEKVFGTWAEDVQEGETIVISEDGKHFREQWVKGSLVSREAVPSDTKLPFGMRRTERQPPSAAPPTDIYAALDVPTEPIAGEEAPVTEQVTAPVSPVNTTASAEEDMENIDSLISESRERNM